MDNSLPKFYQAHSNFNSFRVNPFSTDSILSDSISNNEFMKSNTSDFIVSNHFEPLYHWLNESSSISDLEKAIKVCKQKVLYSGEDNESKSRHVERIIELNKALHTAKELEKNSAHDNFSSSSGKVIKIAGHLFQKTRQGIRNSRYCEVCQDVVHVSRNVLSCQECSIHVHAASQCVQRLTRACPASDVGHPSLFSSQIISGRRFSSLDNGLCIDVETYPISGNLVNQNFQCIECSYPLRPISSGSSNPLRSQAIFCHYYRKFYCSSCHWNNKFLIPSVYFMLGKWDRLPVCRSAYIKLKYVWDRALFRMPIFWEKNCEVAKESLKIRRWLFQLKTFFGFCSEIRKVAGPCPEWIIDQPYLVSMAFVKAICDDTGLTSLRILYSSMRTHISGCSTCLQYCYICEICQISEKIIPSSSDSWTCSKCETAHIHETCGLKHFQTESDYICSHCS